MVFDKTKPFPQLTDEWGYVLWDSLFPRVGEGFSLLQTEDLVQRDNFGILTDNHFYPLPSSAAPLLGLGLALSSLASKLRSNWELCTVPLSLIILLRTGVFSSEPSPLPRGYHTLPNGEFITVIKEIITGDLTGDDAIPIWGTIAVPGDTPSGLGAKVGIASSSNITGVVTTGRQVVERNLVRQQVLDVKGPMTELMSRYQISL